ncbi:MAG: hypothetical protein A4S17_09170 [Proteobacteria bacterium HN_bin10]|nr:MAG: hypothetical protein A4S17_09170 [Proteobacteria bacterium HN_bin10]
MGSWQQQVHNVFGLIEYLGTGAGLMALGWSHTKVESSLTGMALVLSGVAVLVGLVLLSTPSWVGMRGLVQRVTEVIIFGWLTVASLSLIFRFPQPNPALARDGS